jgi:hypothetical protein
MNETIVKHIGPVGRMISSSKVAPKGHLCIWNGNIIVEGKKIWYGDLDLTKQAKELKAAAKEIGKPLYILREHDARFDNEAKPLIENAVEVIKP